MGVAKQHNLGTENSLWQLDAINESLEGASPQTIAVWALAQRLPAMVSTSFGRDAAAMLHLIAELTRSVPTVWVDTGFTTADTRAFARQLTAKLGLDLRVYRPEQPAIRVLQSLRVTDPLDLDPPGHRRLVEIVKLRPFQRAIDDLQPRIWFTGIRAEETSFRQRLAPVTLDDRGIIKVAPFFFATGTEMENYLSQHQLPRNEAYFDPTKPALDQECGLHR